MMAACVSGVNACQYCHGAYTAAAMEFGVPENLIKNLVDDFQTADVSENMKPALA